MSNLDFTNCSVSLAGEGKQVTLYNLNGKLVAIVNKLNYTRRCEISIHDLFEAVDSIIDRTLPPNLKKLEDKRYGNGSNTQEGKESNEAETPRNARPKRKFAIRKV